MPDCGSQITLCDLPIHFDTYKGCSHGCKYCFASKKRNLNDIIKYETPTQLLNFIKGKRNTTTNWCDWEIPIHWGGMSDPFQPVEATIRNTYNCLQILKETQYPFVVSTKGKLICRQDYLDLIKQCNCVVQISLVCPEFDKLEVGAPTFAERLEMIRILSKHKRVIVRIQPYMVEVHDSIKQSIEQIAKAGAYGVTVEAMKFAKKKDGLIRVGGDFCYPKEVLIPRFRELKEIAHGNGLKFYSGENRLRDMGDSLCCCGIDGLKGFIPNRFNLNNILNGNVVKPTKAMSQKGTAQVFKGKYQRAGTFDYLRNQTFKDLMLSELKNNEEYYKQIFGKN